MDFSSYIVGFVDGEGTFNVSFSKRKKFKTGIEVRASFSISQHKRNLDILKEIQKFFNVGNIRYSASDQNYKYEVRVLNDLNEVIIPHFMKYNLKTSKKTDFNNFKTICSLMKQNKHLNLKYLKQIINIAYKMNNLGKRKYKKEELLKFVTR